MSSRGISIRLPDLADLIIQFVRMSGKSVLGITSITPEIFQCYPRTEDGLAPKRFGVFTRELNLEVSPGPTVRSV